MAACAGRSHPAATELSLTSVDRLILFWEAFTLTRPLGAAVGNFLNKPVGKGSLDFSRPVASIVAVILLVLQLPQRAGRHSDAAC